MPLLYIQTIMDVSIWVSQVRCLILPGGSASLGGSRRIIEHGRVIVELLRILAKTIENWRDNGPWRLHKIDRSRTVASRNLRLYITLHSHFFEARARKSGTSCYTLHNFTRIPTAAVVAMTDDPFGPCDSPASWSDRIIRTDRFSAEHTRLLVLFYFIVRVGIDFKVDKMSGGSSDLVFVALVNVNVN